MTTQRGRHVLPKARRPVDAADRKVGGTWTARIYARKAGRTLVR